MIQTALEKSLLNNLRSKRPEKKLKVVMLTEGTYPFNGGGVSTWAHSLCENLGEIDFHIYATNASVEKKTKYKLPNNVTEVTQLPLWAPGEPSDYLNYGTSDVEIIKKKMITKGKVIKNDFLPIFKKFMACLCAENIRAEHAQDVFRELYEYFQNYDYKETMRSVDVWETFRDNMNAFDFGMISNQNYKVSMRDLTIGMQWIYRFMLPFSVNAPKGDVAHVTLAGFPMITALMMKYRDKTPIILTDHGVFIRERLIAISSSEYSFFLKVMLTQLSSMVTEIAYKEADTIVTVSKFNINWEKIYGAEARKIYVIHNGIDKNAFLPAPKPVETRKIPTVVAAARIFDLKDIETMIRSCAVAKQKIPNVKYLVYGDKEAVPEYTAKCEQLIRDLDLIDNFILAGFHDNPQKLYNEGDVSILTSISEGFPYSIIESMSCGIPVIATDVGGVSEAIDSGCGIICKPKDAQSLGESVIKLLENDMLRIEMGRKARQRVADNFTISHFIAQYKILYSALALDGRLPAQQRLLKQRSISKVRKAA